MIRRFLCVLILLSLGGSNRPSSWEGAPAASDDYLPLQDDASSDNPRPMWMLGTIFFTKFAPALLANLSEGGETTFLVVLAEQANLSDGRLHRIEQGSRGPAVEVENPPGSLQ